MEYAENTADLPQVTDRLYYIMLYQVHLGMSVIRTHNLHLKSFKRQSFELPIVHYWLYPTVMVPFDMKIVEPVNVLYTLPHFKIKLKVLLTFITFLGWVPIEQKSKQYVWHLSSVDLDLGLGLILR